jgi:hypothetical protein
MPYSSFSLLQVKTELGLVLQDQDSLFRDVPELEASDLLKATLELQLPLALKLSNEKARSELVITPVLIELLRRNRGKMSLFSGVEFNVDAERNLNGVCDFLISRSPNQFLVEDPVVAIVEAKREDIVGGIPQCLAEMVAAQRFNASAGRPPAAVHGAVTSGSEWRFLRLVGTTAYLDQDEYFISQLGKILGILSQII